ncbi:MAG TPA: maleylacetate reductase [Acidimicrobiales bacterium]|nr:maleylacetate reductase [Acidimicrobiales bacterium]
MTPVPPFVHMTRPGRVLFGVGKVDRVVGEVAGLGIERVLVIAGGSSKPVGDRIADQLGDRYGGSFADVRQHVPEDLVAAARTAAEATGIDGIVAVGGGSAIGLAKAIAVGDDPDGVDGVPIVAVPTTYAGSEMTSIYGITGRHKRTGGDLRALPRSVVYDPALTVGLPPDVTGASGFNALAHAVESLYAPGTDPLVALYAEAGIRALVEGLPGAVDDPADLVARGTTLYGAHLAGRALAGAGTSLHHRLCHVLGGTFGLDHSRTHAVMLPYVVDLLAPFEPEALARAAVALGGPAGAGAGAAAGLLSGLAERLGTPTDLAVLGMPVDGLDEAAELAPAVYGFDVARLRELLGAAFEGSRPWRDM